MWSGSLDETIRCWNAISEDCIKIIRLKSRVFTLYEIRGLGLVLAGCRDEKIPIYNTKSYNQVEISMALACQFDKYRYN